MLPVTPALVLVMRLLAGVDMTAVCTCDRGLSAEERPWPLRQLWSGLVLWACHRSLSAISLRRLRWKRKQVSDGRRVLGPVRWFAVPLVHIEASYHINASWRPALAGWVLSLNDMIVQMVGTICGRPDSCDYQLSIVYAINGIADGPTAERNSCMDEHVFQVWCRCLESKTVFDRRQETERTNAYWGRLVNVDSLTPLCRVVWNFSRIGWLGGTTGSASDQRSEGCGFEAY